MGQGGEFSRPVSNRESCHRRPPGGGSSRAAKLFRMEFERRDCFRSLNGKTKAAPPVPSVQDGARDDPATTSAIDHRGTAVGQTFCEDRDTLAALLMAGVLASSPDDVTTKGCQTIPEGAQVQVLERYPRAFDLFRTVKVQVTTPAMPALKIGYTIEISR